MGRCNVVMLLTCEPMEVMARWSAWVPQRTLYCTYCCVMYRERGSVKASLQSETVLFLLRLICDGVAYAVWCHKTAQVWLLSNDTRASQAS